LTVPQAWRAVNGGSHSYGENAWSAMHESIAGTDRSTESQPEGGE
jgi:hypothetical protein